MTLDTGLLLSTSKSIKLPITDVVIKSVETMAYNQGFKSLKFKNHNGEPIYHVSLIGGVNYEENLIPPNATDKVADAEDAEEEEQDDDSTNSGFRR